MAKRTSPALYEMMRNRAAAGGAGGSSAADATPQVRPSLRLATEDDEVMRDDASPSPVLERFITLLKPGQTVRIPVGYVFAACAAIILLLLIAYMVGVGAGKAIQTAAFHEKFGEGFGISPQSGGVTDPLTLEPLDGSPLGADRRSGTSSDGNPPNRGASDQASRGSPGPANWGPIAPTADPRRKGWNYFIAATNTLARCTQLAEFCRASGLETYVVPHKNGGQVIVFPGYQGQRDAPEVKALEERMHQIGDRYKAANRYETNMRDAYPSKYDG